MTPIVFGLIVLALLMGGAMAGMSLRSMLPESHLNHESKDSVKVAIGLVATMAALVLGLVTASSKSFFDSQDAAVKQSAADFLTLDRLLARYGPETKEIRDKLRHLLVERLDTTWPDGASKPAKVEIAGTTPAVEEIDDQIRQLSPNGELQSGLKSRALESSGTLLKTRWLMLTSSGNKVPMPFLVVLILWLAIIFVSFGLFAPRNHTVLAVFFVCAVSVAAAILLILELNRPFEGMMQVSADPLRYALSHLGQ